MIAGADTGFVVTILYRGDKNHRASAAVYCTLHHIYLPQSTLTEIAYLLAHRAGEDAVVRFLNGLPGANLQSPH